MQAVTRRNFLSFDFGRRSRSGAAGQWIRVHRVAMACRFEVTLPDTDAGSIAAAREALDDADRVEQMLTVFRDSEVTQLNRAASSAPAPCTPDLLDIVSRCHDLHERTAGAFDITSTPLSRCWGFLRREGRIPSPAELDRARAACGLRHVRLDRDAGTIAFDRDGIELSFGAFGKGYALDRMANRLHARGIERALLSAGHSSVLALGNDGDDGWPIDLRPSLAQVRIGRAWITDAALGMSGGGEQFFEVDGVRYGHVLDPRTGRPATGVLSAAVFTRSAADADALSTAFLVGGAALARAYCDAHAGTQVVLVLDETVPRVEVFGHCHGVRLELLR